MKNTTDHQSFIVKPSTVPGAGVGIFALHDVAEGTHMALFAPNFEEEIRQPGDVPEELQIYCIDQKDGSLLCPKYFNCLDIGNYLNHSSQPNMRYVEGSGYVARRDVQAGEELFGDYRELGEPEEVWPAYYTK